MAAVAVRRELADSQWARMEAAKFIHTAFPTTAPKLLGVLSMVAVLEVKFGCARADLTKMSAKDLKATMLAKLAGAAATAAAAED